MIYHIIGRGKGCLGYKNQPGIKWSVNIFRPDVDALFEMHKPAGHNPHIENAIRNGQAVHTQTNYPIDRVIDYFRRDYFGCSIDYMIAFAICLGATQINLWGCNQYKGIDNDPDLIDHQSILFWCGVAVGRDVEIIVHGDSALMDASKGRYGYDY